MEDSTVLAGRIIALLERVAEERRPCRKCGVQIYAIRLPESKELAFYMKDGNVHDRNTCAFFNPDLRKGPDGELNFPRQTHLLDTFVVPD